MDRDVFEALTTRGRIFRVTFVKRSNGEERVMHWRRGVTKHLKGGGAAYDMAAKGLVSVFDLRAKGYRSIPLDAIKLVKARGLTVTTAAA